MLDTHYLNHCVLPSQLITHISTVVKTAADWTLVHTAVQDKGRHRIKEQGLGCLQWCFIISLVLMVKNELIPWFPFSFFLFFFLGQFFRGHHEEMTDLLATYSMGFEGIGIGFCVSI